MAKTTPVPGAASSGAASGSLPPFGSFEQFLFEVITLRSSAAYRADIDKLMEYEDQPAPYNDWVKMFEPGDRPYQCAQSVIATWDLVCKIALGAAYQARQDEFIATILPLGPVYAWLQPALRKIADIHPDGARYAEHFQTLGLQALKKLPSYGAVKSEFGGDIESLTGSRQNEAFRTAWKKNKPLTHFG